MRTVFQHDGGSENRKTGGAVAQRAWNNALIVFAKYRSTRRMFQSDRTAGCEFRHAAYAAVSDHDTENGLPPFTRLPRKRKSEIIDRRSY